jgi:mannan endo-1,4-beta-mannosidase
MRPRFALLISLVLAAVALTYAGSHFVLPTTPPAVHTTLPRGSTSYLGVFEPGSPPAYGPVAGFTVAAGKQPNLVGYYSGWAEPFAASFAEKISSHGAIPYVQIDPTLASVRGIAAGAYDKDYLRPYADSVREFGHSVVIGFGHEMNAPWEPWGYTHVFPATFIAAWRHIVTLFREQGADNVTWLWTINADRPGTGPIDSWWPGGRYVTWVGIDGYYYRRSDTFKSVFGQTIDQVQGFTRKPVLLSETAVAPRAGQFVKIGNLFDGIRQYKTLGLVWFDKDQHGSLMHQDWRIEGDFQAEAAFGFGVAGLTLQRP